MRVIFEPERGQRVPIGMSSFDASSAFSFDKAAGARCRHLRDDCRCAIHDELEDRGFAGCAAYDCYGAGQRATALFASSHDDERRNRTFLVLRTIHELLWLLTEAEKICPPSHRDVTRALADQLDSLESVARSSATALLTLDCEAAHRSAHAVLRRVGNALGSKPKRVLPVVR